MAGVGVRGWCTPGSSSRSTTRCWIGPLFLANTAACLVVIFEAAAVILQSAALAAR
jgi:hypothetical protein